MDDIVDTRSEEVSKNAHDRKRGRLLGDDEPTSTAQDTSRVAIYHHYTTIRGQKFLLTTANKNTLLLRCVPLSAWTKKAKSATQTIFSARVQQLFAASRRPIWCERARFARRQAKSPLRTRQPCTPPRKIRHTWGQFSLRCEYDSQQARPATAGPKFIGVDGARGSLLSAVAEVPHASNSGTTSNIISSLNKEVELATGVDPLQSGVVSNTNLTATESQQIQANANLRVLLGLRINSWGEKAFGGFGIGRRGLF